MTLRVQLCSKKWAFSLNFSIFCDEMCPEFLCGCIYQKLDPIFMFLDVSNMWIYACKVADFVSLKNVNCAFFENCGKRSPRTRIFLDLFWSVSRLRGESMGLGGIREPFLSGPESRFRFFRVVWGSGSAGAVTQSGRLGSPESLKNRLGKIFCHSVFDF